MKPFKLHLIFGFILILTGIIFDFLFVQGKIGMELVRANPPILNSWAKELYSLSAFYMFVLGFLNIALALLIRYFVPSINLDWIVFGLICVESMLVIATGFWYASAGPSLKWETRCTVLTLGLVAIILGLGFELYKILSVKDV